MVVACRCTQPPTLDWEGCRQCYLSWNECALHAADRWYRHLPCPHLTHPPHLLTLWQIGDEAGAAECRRMANAGRLSQRMAAAAGGKQQQQRQQKPGGARKSGTGASTARAGGRRV